MQNTQDLRLGGTLHNENASIQQHTCAAHSGNCADDKNLCAETMPTSKIVQSTPSCGYDIHPGSHRLVCVPWIATHPLNTKKNEDSRVERSQRVNDPKTPR